MANGNYLWTSESVGRGHPDKICDQISDAILDAALEQDPSSRVAVECLVKDNNLVIGGELTTTAELDIPATARATIEDIGFKPEHGFSSNCEIIDLVGQQSPEISQGVTAGEGLFTEQGAGDQGMMMGFATIDTDIFMPMPITLAHHLVATYEDLMKSGELDYLRPDCKSQITVKYEGNKPVAVDAVVIAAQHDEGVEHETIHRDIKNQLILPICNGLVHAGTKYFVNATGAFIIGGPVGDAGLTGRKIIVDTYGGMGKHGGGAFSGKDPSKVDRSGAYAARYIAKNLVAAGLADKCEVQLAYCIGVAEPVSITVDTFGTGKIPAIKLEGLVREYFPLKPADIIRHFDLKRPIFKDTAAYGHFGRNEFPWEATDIAETLERVA